MRTLVVIPVYGQPELIARCLDSITEPVSLFIVDNLGDYKRRGDEVIYHAGCNLGWLTSCNIGLRYGAAQGYDAIVLLNNDTQLAPGFFAGLLQGFDIPAAGMVVPKYDGEMSPRQMVEGGFAPAAVFEPAEFVDGTCLCISTRAFQSVGELDPIFEPTGWGAEVDYCMRLRAAGFVVLVSGLAFLQHDGCATAEVVYGSRGRYMEQGCANARAAFAHKYGADWEQIIPFRYKQIT